MPALARTVLVLGAGAAPSWELHCGRKELSIRDAQFIFRFESRVVCGPGLHAKLRLTGARTKFNFSQANILVMMAQQVSAMGKKFESCHSNARYIFNNLKHLYDMYVFYDKLIGCMAFLEDSRYHLR